ncbi:MAG: Uma2 family endonuclease [Caldilineaceae bacterium SB0664_bin_22]|nr:Uma2 family endonuclease [Caldilineaceae bacterium SB0664_bin_22]
MAAVEVRKQTPTATGVANGRETAPVVPISVDEPGMTRERRAALIALRRTHVVQWRAGLKQLPHFDPVFPYDIVHEYDLDWTTDPDYGHDAVKYLEINEDGAVTSEKPKNKVLHVAMLRTLLAMLGQRVVMEPRLHFGPELGAAASLFTSLGEPSIRVEPDLAVLVPGTVLSGRQIWDITYDIHVDTGDLVPVLVCEILSDSTAARDLDGKRRLYETLGIAEYVLCDVLGGPLNRGESHSPPGMVVYRLEDGVYRESRAAGPDPSVFRSNVLGTSVRLLPPRDPARAREDFRFQWWDGEQGRWRDHRTDAEYKQERRGREQEARGEVKMAIAALYSFLPELPRPSLDQIAAHWREHGLPDNVMDHILAVRETPSMWRALLLPGVDSDADRPA